MTIHWYFDILIEVEESNMTSEISNDVQNALEEVLQLNLDSCLTEAMRTYLLIAAEKISNENLTEPADAIATIRIAIQQLDTGLMQQ